MKTRRLRQTLMDYMVIGISPALIMGMVGSMLFFLLAVFYQGQHEMRMHFIFAMFTMAIVLIARISMEEGIEYASMFGIALAVVTFMALMRFAQFSGPFARQSMLINCTLIGVVWWSAHKLTWDCTFIDDQQDASGEGLLQGLGLDSDTVAQQANQTPDGNAVAQSNSAASPNKAKKKSSPGWYQRMVSKRHRPHTPGVWVIYYAIAALPLFAFGQLLIPATQTAARLSAFRLICVYLACALGLLLTTSFLGLRRYLRQRNLQMPGDMAGVWLGLGGVMILTILLLCLFLPRPGAALTVSQLPFGIGSHGPQKTSPYAIGNDGPENSPDATRTSNSAQQPSESAQSSTQSPNQPTSDQPQSQESSSTQSNNGGQQSGQQPSGPQQPEQQQQQQQPGEQQPEADRNAPKFDERRSKQDSSQREPATEEPSERPSSDSKSTNTPQKSWDISQLVKSAPGWIGNLLKLVFFAGLVCLAVYFGWKNRARIAESLAQLWRDFWQLLSGLWGGKRRDESAEQQQESAATGPAPPAFASFKDPFNSGTAERASTEQLIRYSFEALEAWGRERGCPRAEGITPLEYVQRISQQFDSVGAETLVLGDLYSRVAYGREAIAPARRDDLRRLWQQMRAAERARVRADNA